MSAGNTSRPRIPRGVWALGFVSLFMDMSSELVHALLPLFLVSGLGVSVAVVGLIEGVAEAVASVTKAFSGVISDRLRKRKALAVIGYGLAALSKPLFPLAGGAGMIFFARVTDRLGKGIRGAPRDALVADLVDESIRGAAYGLRQALDTVGALLGPLAAAILMVATANDFRTVFWFAVIPAAICVVILVTAVKEPPALGEQAAKPPPRLREMGKLGAAMWTFTGVAFLLTLARFSEAFLLLRAGDLGMTLGAIPLVMVVMNAVYALVAYPMGHLSDRFGRAGVAVTGFMVMVLANMVLATAGQVWTVLLGAGIWGIHLGMTQGVLSAVVADLAPPHLRGTAFGVFHTASGLGLLGASLAAGVLWQTLGPAFTFYASAAMAVVGIAAFLAWLRVFGADHLAV